MSQTKKFLPYLVAAGLIAATPQPASAQMVHNEILGYHSAPANSQTHGNNYASIAKFLGIVTVTGAVLIYLTNYAPKRRS